DVGLTPRRGKFRAETGDLVRSGALITNPAARGQVGRGSGPIAHGHGLTDALEKGLPCGVHTFVLSFDPGLPRCVTEGAGELPFLTAFCDNRDAKGERNPNRRN